MDFSQIKELVELVNKTDLTDVKIEQDDFKITIKRQKENQIVQPQVIPQVMQAQSTVPVVQSNVNTEVSKETDVEDDANTHIIKSPIVGTFYAAPSPDADNFVARGTKVSEGDTLCIIEAMKLMNEIESDVSGDVVEILVSNEDPIEYGQPLFKIKTS